MYLLRNRNRAATIYIARCKISHLLNGVLNNIKTYLSRGSRVHSFDIFTVVGSVTYVYQLTLHNNSSAGLLNLKRARCHEHVDSALKTQVAKINRPTRGRKREVVSGA